MIIKKMSVKEAQKQLEKEFGVRISFTQAGVCVKGRRQVVVCDRRGLDGARWTVAVHEGPHAHLIERINVW